MKRIYISGAITGTNDAEIRFSDAEEYLSIVYPEAELINPERIGRELARTSPGLTHEDYMCISKAEIDLCDALFMIPGWQQSRGANWEKGYAEGKGKEILLLHDDWYQETEKPSKNISQIQ